MRHKIFRLFLFLAVSFFLTGCDSKSNPVVAEFGHIEEGLASWYGEKYHGRTTASGEVFDKNAISAAHKELPFGTWVEVTNLDNGRKLRVRINDRGPFIEGRIIDLSERAASELGMKNAGIARVVIRVVSGPG